MRQILALAAIAILVSGCATWRCHKGGTTERIIETVDTVSFRPDTVGIHIPEESATDVVHIGDTSMVQTSFAEAAAWVEDGEIHQRIRNRSEQLHRIKIDVPVYVHSRKEYLTQTVTQEVEKPLGWFRKTLMYAGAAALIALLAAAVIAGIRHWNRIKQLFKPF